MDAEEAAAAAAADMEPMAYDYEMYGGLVNSAVRAARGFEKDESTTAGDNGLDKFMKEVYLFKQALYRHVIDTHESQSPNINYIYEGILSRVYSDIGAGACRPAAYELPAGVERHLANICKMVGEHVGPTYEHWLRRLMKECPYAYNMRSATAPSSPPPAPAPAH